MSTAPVNLNEFHEDSLHKSLVERESVVKEQLQAAWHLHIARVQEELESGWKNHIGVAIEGVLVNLQDSLRGEMQQIAKQLADSQTEEVRREGEENLRVALEQAARAAEEAKQEAGEAMAEALASLRASLEEERLQEMERQEEEKRQELERLEEEKRLELEIQEEAWKQEVQALHKAVRRCEQAESRDDVIAALLDGVAPYAERAVLLQLDGHMITDCHGIPQREEGAEPLSLDIPVEQAAALHNAKQSAEPLVAMRLDSEFSSELLGHLGEAVDEKLRVFPVISRNSVKALLVLEAGSRPFSAGAVEILTISAGHKWITGKESTEPAQLIAIQGTGSSEPKPREQAQPWFQLSPQEQEIHLRAQRFARVQVAELRLYQSERVRQARKDNNLYGVFRQEIDRVREEFRTQFVETCPSMLDYYHMELVRILANEKEKVLGPGYPGPLV